MQKDSFTKDPSHKHSFEMASRGVKVNEESHSTITFCEQERYTGLKFLTLMDANIDMFSSPLFLRISTAGLGNRIISDTPDNHSRFLLIIKIITFSKDVSPFLVSQRTLPYE
jgi:hypothetical protein